MWGQPPSAVPGRKAQPSPRQKSCGFGQARVIYSSIPALRRPYMTDPRFPIGKFHFDGPPTEDQRAQLIAKIEQTPAALRAAVERLSPQQLDTPYREGGWTVRQVTHHVPDSHMNAYVRFKLALTEDEPTIKPYAE